MIEAHGRQHDGGTSGMALQEEDGRSVVKVWGEIDLETRRSAGELCQAVADRGLPVVIDAQDVTFMDSTGMSILVRLARDGESRGYPVSLHHAPWLLRELLSITGVDQLLQVTEESDEASTDTPV
ncbi:MAG TPA: STAS domain-containing protein [Actinotalea sp.]|jgi:anti-anti-sigma factor